MRVPIVMLRLLLAALCLLFSHALGRSAYRARLGREPRGRIITWILRTTVTLVGVVWSGGADALTIAVVVLAAGSFAFGWILEGRPKEAEHYEDVMFPKK